MVTKMYPIISIIINEGIKQLNVIKHDHAETAITITFYNNEAGFKEYILKAELQRKQGQEVFDWVKRRIVEEQKKYQTYLDDIIDLYESFRNFSNSVLKPMSSKIKSIVLLEEARTKWVQHLSNVKMKINMLKKEIAVNQDWPAELGMQKWEVKKTSSKILAELPELTNASKEYRKQLKQNGMIFYLKDCIAKEDEFLEMLPMKVDAIYKVKTVLVKYLSV